MLHTSTLEPLRNTRVRVEKIDSSEIFGVLRGITDEKIFINEEPILRAEIDKVDPAMLVCSNCHRAQNRLASDGNLCASCYREEAKRQPAFQEPCAVCGRPGVRNIRKRNSEFLCAQHHAEAGSDLVIHPAAGGLLASCATDDVTSDRHEWGQVRGARFRCVRCKKAEKYDPELLAELDRLRG
jgi:hypothetical protein